jgi:SET domain
MDPEKLKKWTEESKKSPQEDKEGLPLSIPLTPKGNLKKATSIRLSLSNPGGKDQYGRQPVFIRGSALTNDLVSVLQPFVTVKKTSIGNWGLFALKNIPQDTVLLLEEPLFSLVLPPSTEENKFGIGSVIEYFVSYAIDESMDKALSIEPKLAQLFPREDSNEFIQDYCSKYPNLPAYKRTRAGRLYSKMFLNYFRVDGLIMLFHQASFINHSCCEDNASYKYRITIMDQIQIVVKASRDIQEGEEITFCYPDSPAFRAQTPERKGELLSKCMGFTCTCPAHIPHADK